MTETIISYYLNGEYIEGWDYQLSEGEEVDMRAAADNLTDWVDGDILTALVRTWDGSQLVEQEYSIELG